MAADDVDLVRRAYEAFGRRDFQTLLAAMDPAIRLRPMMAGGRPMNPDMRDEYVGVDGVMEFFGILEAAFDDLEFVPDEFRDAGDDHVLAFVRMRARGKESGAPVEQPMAIVATVREGRIVAQESYWDRREALERVGLA